MYSTRPTLKRLIDGFIRVIAARSGTRSILNGYYTLLDAKARSRFHSRYAKLFRQDGPSLSPGEWSVSFNNQHIRMPLRTLWSWLDWDTAVSIVGHDIEVKQTYEALLASIQRPALFLDIGANYGTHSILFLSAGIPIIAFEPNPSCFEAFETICKLNGFRGRWEQVAIGSSIGEIELSFPERDTWLGSVSPLVVSKLQTSDSLTKVRVAVRTLDHYREEIPRGMILIKIDVEGYETEVLKGAANLIQDRKPIIIFESNDATSRCDLFSLLKGFSYCVYALPWRPSVPAQPLCSKDFISSRQTNFMASPNTPIVS